MPANGHMRDPFWFVNRRLVGWNTDLTAGEPGELRRLFEQMMTSQPLSDDVQATPGELGDFPTLTITIDGAPADRTHLWFHGGWYVIGSPRTSAGLSADLARRGAARAVSIDYRLAPEHPYPAALQDARRHTRLCSVVGSTRPRSPSSASRPAEASPPRRWRRWATSGSRSRRAPSSSRLGPT